MSLIQVNLIGCGRLGKTIGSLLHTTQVGKIAGVVNASFESAQAAVEFIGQGQAYKSLEELPPADVYLIATPDNLIQATGENLLINNHVENKILIHCSGSLSSDVLQQAKQKNCLTASLHPIKSFAKPDEAIHTFSGTYCALEGDTAVLPFLTELFEKMGARVFQISKEQKSLYHAACVLANNYLVSLHYQASLAYKSAGLDEATAQTLVSTLMADALNNVSRLSPQEALTGPLQRGDTGTIEKHMKALEGLPVIRMLYAALGEATLGLTSHGDVKMEMLKEALGVGNKV